MKAVFSNYLTPFKRKRIVAFIIDIIIIVVIVNVSNLLFGLPDFSKYSELMKESALISDIVKQKEIQALAVKKYMIAWNLSLLYFFGYELICQFIFKGATIGKKIMKLTITSTKDRNLFLFYFFLILRSAVKYLSIWLFRAYPFMISSLFFIADENGQATYDKLFKLLITKSANK